MSMLPVPTNPFFYAQYRLQGGHKVTTAVTGVYALLIGLAVYYSTLDKRGMHQPWLVAQWAEMLLGLQLFVLLMYGTYRVDASVRGDVSQKMLESHRLMPITPLAAVSGYTVGAPIGSICLAAVNFLMGLGCCSFAGLDVSRYMIATLVIVVTSYCVWTAVMQYAFLARGGFLILVAACGLLVGTRGEISSQFPALETLLYPLQFRSVLDLRHSPPSDTSLLISIGAELTVTAICGWAAVRRYRAPDVVGIPPFQGIILLLVMVMLTAAPFCDPDSFFSASRYVDDYGESPDLYTAGWTSCLLVSLFPLAAMARHSVRFKRGLTPRRPRSDLGLAGVFLTLMLLCIALGPVLHRRWSRVPAELLSEMGFVAVVVFLFTVGTWFVFRVSYLIKVPAWVVAIFWVLLTWVGPVVAQAVVVTVNQDRGEHVADTLSPIVALHLRFQREVIPVWPGVAGQAVIALIPVLIWMMASRRRKYQDAAVVG